MISAFLHLKNKQKIKNGQNLFFSPNLLYFPTKLWVQMTPPSLFDHHPFFSSTLPTPYNEISIRPLQSYSINSASWRSLMTPNLESNIPINT